MDEAHECLQVREQYLRNAGITKVTEDLHSPAEDGQGGLLRTRKQLLKMSGQLLVKSTKRRATSKRIICNVIVLPLTASTLVFEANIMVGTQAS